MPTVSTVGIPFTGLRTAAPPIEHIAADPSVAPSRAVVATTAERS
ncbi:MULTISPECIES: hypothetical protein [unclassified Microbacterium]|nr:hypothetical protein [Microbacterium sp. Gd 4-13]